MLLSFVYFTLLHATLGLLISPINQQCLETNYTLGENSTRPARITLPPFSYSEIWFDFRHISLDSSSANISVVVNNQTIHVADIMGQAVLYSLFVT